MKMERRELYEPEDIEQLLIERPYDELLEMERAFVLRHLSGREEYEAMRALLLKVHDDDAHLEPIDAEPSVREHVLNVFRSEQRPQWRIWLNSAGAFFLPKDTFSLWRPALALGSVALVVWLVVIGTRQMEQATAPQMAEVRGSTKDTEEGSATKKPQEQPAPTVEPSAGKAEPSQNSVTFTDAVNEAATEEQATRANDLHADPARKAEAEESPAPPAADGSMLDVAGTESETKAGGDAEFKDITLQAAGAISLDTASIAAGSAVHTVTSDELARNFSAANATAVQMEQTVSTQSVQRSTMLEKEKRDLRGKRSKTFDGNVRNEEATADASAYIGLLRAAW